MWCQRHGITPWQPYRITHMQATILDFIYLASLTILTIFDQFDHFNHFWPFFSILKFFETCQKLAQNLPESCPFGPVIFYIIDHHNMSFLIWMLIFNSLAWIHVCQEHSHTWRALLVPDWRSGGLSNLWCQIWHHGSQ